MAYLVPTPADLKAEQPAFAGVADETVQRYLDKHPLMVDPAKWPSQAAFSEGVILYACHLMFRAGVGPGAAAVADAPPGLKLRKAGDRTEEFFAPSEMAGGGSGAGLGATSYGRDLKALQRRLFGGPRVF